MDGVEHEVLNIDELENEGDRYIEFEVEEMGLLSSRDPRVHALSSEQIAVLGEREWWGLPVSLTGILISDVIRIVITALCFACTFEIGGVMTTLCEFLMFANENVSSFLQRINFSD
jgi:hypothetical protein